MNVCRRLATTALLLLVAHCGAGASSHRGATAPNRAAPRAPDPLLACARDPRAAACMPRAPCSVERTTALASDREEVSVFGFDDAGRLVARTTWVTCARCYGRARRLAGEGPVVTLTRAEVWRDGEGRVVRAEQSFWSSGAEGLEIEQLRERVVRERADVSYDANGRPARAEWTRREWPGPPPGDPAAQPPTGETRTRIEYAYEDPARVTRATSRVEWGSGGGAAHESRERGRFEFEGSRLLRRVSELPGGGTLEVRYGYSAAGRLETREVFRCAPGGACSVGATDRFSYDSRGRLTGVAEQPQEGAGGVVALEYEGEGAAPRRVAREGRWERTEERFEYDGGGRLVRAEGPWGAVQEERYAYGPGCAASASPFDPRRRRGAPSLVDSPFAEIDALGAP